MTFDLEKAQLVELLAAGEHEQWADWAQSILDSEPGLSNGRKAAWPEMIATPYKNLSEDLKEKDRREVYLRSSVALAEIERLRADAEQHEIVIEARLEVIDEQAGRIKELEAALVEERARGNHYGMSYEEALSPDQIERWIINGEKDVSKIYIDRVRDEARRQLQAEGKIGTSDHIVETDQMVWQITEERKAALGALLEYISYDAHDDIEICGHAAVLLAMLQEAE